MTHSRFLRFARIKISDFVTVATTAKPPSINLDDFYASTSASTSSSSTSAANLTSSTSETRSGTTASSSTPATPTESNHIEPDSSAATTDSTLTFAAVSFGILVVLVGVIVTVLWNRSKPTASGENLEESALLSSHSKEHAKPTHSRTSSSGRHRWRSETEDRAVKKVLDRVAHEKETPTGDSGSTSSSTNSASDDDDDGDTEEHERRSRRSSSKRSKDQRRRRTSRRKKGEDDDEVHMRHHEYARGDSME